MDQKKKAMQIGGLIILVAAVAMVVFYKVWDRAHSNIHLDDSATEQSSTPADPGTVDGTVPELHSEYIGTYAATDGAMEAAGQRITSFTIQNTDGIINGTAKIDTIGSDDSMEVTCDDVRTDGKEFFLKCSDPAEGIISVNGASSKDAAGNISVNAKVLWTQKGDPVLDVTRQFQLLKNQ